MAKKSSKASSPSWRTLMRRAKDEDKAGKPKVAATLRQQAADMRKGTRGKAKSTSPKKTEPRSEVMKRAWATRRRNKANAGHAAMDAARTEAKAVMAAAGGSYQRTPAPHHFEQSATLREPGHGEIVGGAEHQFAEEIAKLARKKGGKDAIQNQITERIATARAEGENLGRRHARKDQADWQRQMDAQIIGGFLAEIAQMKRLDGGMLNAAGTITTAALVMEKIYSALVEAGYMPGGRRP